MNVTGSGTSQYFKNRLVTGLITIILLIYVLILTISGYPSAPLFFEASYIRAFFRLGISGLLIVRYLRMPNADIILYGRHREGRFDRNVALGYYAYRVIPFLSILLALGLFTDVIAILLWIAHAVSIRESKYYGIENIQLQLTCFFLPWLGLGQVLSIDNLLGIEPLFASSIMFNAFLITFGVFLFSAGYEKLRTDIWLSGDAAVYFLQSPHLTRPRLRQFVGLLPIRLLTYIILIVELIFLVSFLSKISFVICLVILVGFAISLFTIASLSFIGENLFLILSLFAGTIITGWRSYPSTDILLNSTITIQGVLGAAIVMSSLLVVLWPDETNFGLRDLVQVFSGLNIPIMVFNRRHLFGVFTYQLRHVDSEGQKSTTLPAFDSDGQLGSYQRFRPRTYQSPMYPVTDYCLKLLRQGRGSPSNKSLDKIHDLCAAAAEIGGFQSGSIELLVKPYDANDPKRYLSKSYVPVAEWDIQSDQLTRLKRPPEPQTVSRQEPD